MADHIEWVRLWWQECKITCPACSQAQPAVIEQYDGEPWARYIHRCSHCGYLIMESEFVEVPGSRGILHRGEDTVPMPEEHPENMDIEPLDHMAGGIGPIQAKEKGGFPWKSKSR